MGDGRAVGRIPGDTDPGSDVFLGGLVLGRDDDCRRGKFLSGRRGGLLVVEAEGRHEFDEGGQCGHCSREGEEEGRGRGK